MAPCTVKKSCMAFAIRICAARRTQSLTTAFSTSPKPFLSVVERQPIASSVFETRTLVPSRSFSQTSRRLFSSSSFEAPDPPSSNGVPVFPDINFSNGKLEDCASAVRNRDPDAVFVVHGASRGIGLEFVRALLERTRGTIIACCRSPETSTGLQNLLSSSPNSHRILPVQLDIEDESSLNHAVSQITTLSSSRIDVLLNVAGILGDGGSKTPGPERSIRYLQRSWMEKSMVVNALGPLLLTQGLAPLLRSRGRRKGGASGDPPRPTTVVANLSARVGSISDNGLGGWYSYRMSKAALNQGTRTMAHELGRQGTYVVALHPGTTETDLSAPFRGNVPEGRLFPVEFTVERLLDVIDCLEDGNSGGLYDWSGKALPF